MKCTEQINGRPCNGEMKWGKALTSVWGVNTPDFIGDSTEKPRRGQTLNAVGSELSTVRKCERCGHSVKP